MIKAWGVSLPGKPSDHFAQLKGPTGNCNFDSFAQVLASARPLSTSATLPLLSTSIDIGSS